MFSKKMAFFNVLDHSRYFQSKISKSDEFTMTFEKSEKNAEDLEVEMTKGSKVNFFDLDTIELDRKPKRALSLKDRILSAYYQNVWNRDFGYITKGLRVDGKSGEGPHMMFVGNLHFNPQ